MSFFSISWHSPTKPCHQEDEFCSSQRVNFTALSWVLSLGTPYGTMLPAPPCAFIKFQALDQARRQDQSPTRFLFVYSPLISEICIL